MGVPPPPAGPEPLNPQEWAPPRYLRRHAQRAARRRRMRRLLLGGIVLCLVFGYVLADGGLLSILGRTLKIRRLESQVAHLEARRHALEQEIQRRQNDPATIERLAREEYGMVYPGEKLIRIIRVDEAEARRVEAARKRASQTTAPAPRP